MSLSWTRLNSPPENFASAMWLMPDGSVLINPYNDTKLVALYPDSSGSYANGYLKPAGNLLQKRWAFSSAVLSDGKLVICGGEYSGTDLKQTETNACEIYDSLTEATRQLAPPAGWSSIGDSPTAVLSDGTFLIGNTQGMGQQVALLEPSTLTWSFGGGDSDNEQGYALMQTGDVLTTGVYNQTSKRYNRSANAFVDDAPLPVMLGAGSETGPGLSLLDGRVIWFGASGHTCIYTPGGPGRGGTWVQGPDLPKPNGDQLVAADVPAILEPNGKVFLVVSGTKTPTSFAEYDPRRNEISLVDGAPPAGGDEQVRLLLLPNGHGLVSMQTGWYDVTFSPAPDTSLAPTISAFPATVACNRTVKLSGTQLCGLSECQSYGDDNQQAENYPIVRIIDANARVKYVRAHDVSTRSIAPREPGDVFVDIPAGLAPGSYSVEVVAMGIASTPRAFEVVLPTRSFAALDLQSIFVLGSDGNLWLERAPFGNVPPSRNQVDGNVLAFQPLDVSRVFVLGSDGNLWLEQEPFGVIPPSRQQIDGNVSAFQGLDSLNVIVLGRDGKLWLERAPFGHAPPARAQIDGNVRAFEALDAETVVVLGTDGKLWLEHAPFGQVPPARQEIDANVASFKALDNQTIVVLGTDGKLWLEHGPFGNIPPVRQQIDGNVSAFAPLDSQHLLVLGTDRNLWLERAPFGKVPPAREHIDGNVRAFQGLNSDRVFVLGTDGKLWLEQAPFGTVPPTRQQVDGNVA